MLLPFWVVCLLLHVSLFYQKVLSYDSSSGTAYCSEDAKGPSSSRLKKEQLEVIKKLKAIDPKTFHRLEKVRDLILFRHGSTGVAEVRPLSWC